MSKLNRLIMGSRIFMLTIIIFMLTNPVKCLRWRISGQPAGKSPEEHVLAPPVSLIKASDAYTTALLELQELESEPLCHRIAARLLVGNCQLLDGQNEATVLTDTGRAARDFVDSFAASLAICDLERANFDIPAPCYKFRETVLANLPEPSKPQLHVATAEIDRCLEGLGRSDSAWNTWVSYRHKAMRFCEAARAENKKDQHIILHQRLATILDGLTRQAENETQEHVKNLERIFQKSNENADFMTAQVEKFETATLRLNDIIESALSDSAHTQRAVQQGMEGAKTLDHFIEAILYRLKLREEEMSQGYEVALRTATEVAIHDVAEIAQLLRVASVNSVSLQAHLQHAEEQVLSVVLRQEAIERTMENLQCIADVVLEKQTMQDRKLESTHNQTLNILTSLEAATTTVSTLQGSLPQLGTTSPWLYAICAAASLVLGSYGLQPSLTRNVGLVALGFFIPWSYGTASQKFQSSSPSKTGHPLHMTTDDYNSTTYSDTFSAGSNIEI
ncbi:hypothetical protein E4U21_002582 [Claviceps maximensis]|nr:hypothetical protein E4U21_002582 [Claviceps maximensis]